MIRVIVCVAGGVFGLFFALTLLVPAVGASLPAVQQLTYTLSNTNGNTEIWLFDPHYRLTVRLATHSAPLNNLVWSPDGAHLAYHVLHPSEHQLHIYTPRTGTRRLFRGRPVFPSAPTWSPDSQQLALISDQDRGLFKLYVMDARTANLTLLPTVNAPFDRPPLWSADGEYIYFYAVDEARRRLISQYDLDSGEARIVRAFEERIVLYMLSPDARKLIILMDDRALVVDNLTQSQTSRQTVGVIPYQLASQMVWSPDGETLVFISRETQSPQLYRLVLEGGNISLLVPLGDVFQPVWSPDGAQIAFLGSDRGRVSLYISDNDGGNLRSIQHFTPLNLSFNLVWRPAS